MLLFLLRTEVGGQGGVRSGGRGKGRGPMVPPVCTQDSLREFKLSRKTGSVTQA